MEQSFRWIFWLSVALGAYVYFAYPLILTGLAFLFGRTRRSDTQASDRDWPVTALLISCFNEEKEIGKRILNTTGLDYPHDKLLVLILNDGSVDSTAEVAFEIAQEHPDRHITILDFPENRGKCATLFRGVQWVKANQPDVTILAFSDANSCWVPGALKKLVEPFSDPNVGSVSGLLNYINPESSPAGSMEGLYWRYEVFLKRMSSRLGSLPGGIGSIFALRLDAYEPLCETRGDDFELPVQAIIKGYRSILVEEAASSEPPSADFLTEYRRKLRIMGMMIPSAVMLFGRALARGRLLLTFQLLSHKLLRYLVPFYQIALLVSAAALWKTGLLYQVTLAVQIFFYGLALLGFALERAGHHPPRPLQIPLYFTMVNLASLVSIFRVITRQPVHWEKNR